MRLLRIGTVVLLVLCLLVNFWVTMDYNSSHNTEKPEIQCQNDYVELSVKDPEETLLQGLTATDAQDGDLTNRILLANKSFFLLEKGVFDAEYVVFDSHQNACTYTRRICYTDYESPRFSLDAPLVYAKGQNARFLEHVHVTDMLDGDISDQITVLASDVSNFTVGTYPVLLQVTNSFGDSSEVELMVVIREAKPQTVRIQLSQYLVYLKVGETFDPYRLITSVTQEDGTHLSKDDVQVLGSVDTQNPGYYHLLYRHEASQTQVYLTVVVEKEAK